MGAGEGALSRRPRLLTRAAPYQTAARVRVRARGGEFDGVVAMYHDQEQIALKLLGGLRAVNISARLPLVRTSVAHGTAYDIAGRGVADATRLLEAARAAAQLCRRG